MDDYISREKALQFRLSVNASREANRVTVARGVADAIAGYIKAIPLADVRPVVRGHWILDRGDTATCSNCGNEILARNVRDHLFCHNCGADMRPEGGAESDDR